MINKWMWMVLSLLVGLMMGCDNEMRIQHGQLGALAVEEAVAIKKEEKSKVAGKVKLGTIIDRFNGVAVYYNGNLRNTAGRNVASDGYNLGLKWQCVEFVKRYYYLKRQHKMPDPWGHAIDFFAANLTDGAYNPQRNLKQFRNPSKTKPALDDIIVFSGGKGNPYGHVAIVSKVGANYIEIVQQNVGKQSRHTLPLFDMVGSWRIANVDVLGWLGDR